MIPPTTSLLFSSFRATLSVFDQEPTPPMHFRTPASLLMPSSNTRIQLVHGIGQRKKKKKKKRRGRNGERRTGAEIYFCILRLMLLRRVRPPESDLQVQDRTTGMASEQLEQYNEYFPLWRVSTCNKIGIKRPYACTVGRERKIWGGVEIAH